MTLPSYLSSNTADIVANRSESVGSALMDFLRRRDPEPEANWVSPSEVRREVSGISYSIRGSGQALLLGRHTIRADVLFDKLDQTNLRV